MVARCSLVREPNRRGALVTLRTYDSGTFLCSWCDRSARTGAAHTGGHVDYACDWHGDTLRAYDPPRVWPVGKLILEVRS